MTTDDDRDDDPELDAMTGELIGKSAAGPLELVIEPEFAFQLVGLVQLAKLDPKLPASARLAADVFLMSARGYFADCPTVLHRIRLGDADRAPWS